jgi:hypothetical protein
MSNPHNQVWNMQEQSVHNLNRTRAVRQRLANMKRLKHRGVTHRRSVNNTTYRGRYNKRSRRRSRRRSAHK